MSNSVHVSALLSKIIKELTDSEPCTLFFGGYGEFDELALLESKKIKARLDRGLELIFMTPYITEDYQRKLAAIEKDYDAIIYPEIERVPYRFAISARNKSMIETSDVVIAYINHSFGGAYKSVLHAVKSKKRIINLGSLVSDGMINYSC